MVRSHRSLAWSLVLVLLCASLTLAQKPSTVQAAANTYFVDTALDSAPNASACTAAADDCSLRQAIDKANTDTGTSQIVFDIPADDTNPNYGYDTATGTWSIKPLSTLPPLSAGGTEILGRNNNGGGTPRIVIDGSALTGGGVGFRINSADNAIKLLVIINFSGASTTGIGIRLHTTAATNNTIIGNYIGNRPGGTAFPNTVAGIQLDSGAHDNIIGTGSNPGERNVISGNGAAGSAGDGIRVQNAPNNKVQGNYIGLGLNSSFSTLLLPNTGNGINVIDSAGNTIGGTLGSLRNVISGNQLNGVILTGDVSANNIIAGNYIGVNETGAFDLGNIASGVVIADGAHNNTVSGTSGAGSVISGNGDYGVLLTDDFTTANRVYGSYIGVNAGGSTARPNDKGGVYIRNNANNNIVGQESQGNTISGNTGYGISFGRTPNSSGFTDTLSNTVASNYIGLNALGTTVVSNTLGGVLIGSGTKINRIGGSSPGAQNIISGNGGPGVTISGTQALSNTVTGNIIGLRRASAGGPITTLAGNSGDGVLIAAGALGTRVGGTISEANTIAANTGNGVHVSGSTTNITTIQFNYIGVAFNAGAYIAARNDQNGVLVDTGAQRVAILDNHISRNALKGIALSPQTGSASNANHDIDPPTNVHLNQNGLLTGRVAISGPSDACAMPCTIQVFTTDPAALDGQGRDKVTPANFTITSNGYFTGTLAGVPPEIALTATDKNGNTSEFGRLTARYSIQIDDAVPSQQTAVPGQTITYTHRLVNNGTIDLVDLRLKADSSRKWDDVKTIPPMNTNIALAAGATKLVTLTLKLPAAPDPRVVAGPPADTTVISITSATLITVTDSATDITTVAAVFRFDAQPRTRSALGAPQTDQFDGIVRYVHTLTNIGNITGTVLVSAATQPGWATTVSSDTVTLKPGEVKNITVNVTIPLGTNAPKTAVTIVTATALGQTILLTDTTTVEGKPSALLLHASEAAGEAGAGQTISFLYTVENRSNINGLTTFSLNGLPSFDGSTVVFKRLDGQLLGPGNSFALSNLAGSNQLNFLAEVKVDPKLLVGSLETVTVLLLDDQGRTIASAQDRITVKQTAFAPRLYLPMIMK